MVSNKIRLRFHHCTAYHLQIMWFTCSLSLVLNLKHGIKMRKISYNVLLGTYTYLYYSYC